MMIVIMEAATMGSEDTETEGQGGTTEEQGEQGQGQQVGEIPDVPSDNGKSHNLFLYL
jgi:hypothetical protein